MKRDKLSWSNEESAIIRLTTLWALNESALGGVLHLFRSPFSGLLLASIAVTIISLIAFASSNPAKQILKALMIVLLIKLTISPHSPITAYFAVAFQGLMGAFLFSVFPFRLAALLLGILGLVESVLQKLLTLTLFFGMPLWESLDKFGVHVMKLLGVDQNSGFQGSSILIGSYIFLYLVVGVIVGLMIGSLPERIDAAIKNLVKPKLEAQQLIASSKRTVGNFWQSKKFRYFSITMALLFVINYFVPGASEILKPLVLFIRVAVLLIAWYLVVSPILMKLLKGFLKKRESKYQDDVKQALALMPAFRELMRQSWLSTKSLKGLKRIRQFLVNGLAYCLMYNEREVL